MARLTKPSQAVEKMKTYCIKGVKAYTLKQDFPTRLWFTRDSADSVLEAKPGIQECQKSKGVEALLTNVDREILALVVDILRPSIEAQKAPEGSSHVTSSMLLSVV